MNSPDDLFTVRAGSGPLILSVPHAGTLLPPDIARRLTPEARGLPDTDWYVDDLYDFAGAIGAYHDRRQLSSLCHRPQPAAG